MRALLLAILVALASLAPGSARGGYDFERDIPTPLVASTPVVADYPFTISVWLTPEVANVTQTVVGLADDAVTNRGAQLSLTTTGACSANVFDGVGAGNAISSNTTSAGVRTHLCGVYTSATDRRAVLAGNWASSTQNTTSRALSSLDNTSIGIFQSSVPGNAVDGVVEHVAIWDVALTQGEVESLAAGAHPFAIRRSALRCYVSTVRPAAGERDLVAGLLFSGTPDAGPTRSLRGLHGR